MLERHPPSVYSASIVQCAHRVPVRTGKAFVRAERYLTCRVITKGIKATVIALLRTYSAKR